MWPQRQEARETRWAPGMYLVSKCSVGENVVFMVKLWILQDLSDMLMPSIAKYHVKAGNNKGRIKSLGRVICW